MSSRGGTAEDPSAVCLPHESSLDRKSTDTAMRLVIQPTSLHHPRPLNPDQPSLQNTLKTSLLVSSPLAGCCSGYLCLWIIVHYTATECLLESDVITV